MDVTPIIEPLNEAQREAVTAPDEPMLVVAGAGSDWCSMLTDSTLLALLQRAAVAAEVLLPREAGNVEFWGKLLGPRLRPAPALRAAAHAACLQTVLTDLPESLPMLRAAARRSQPPRYRTAAPRRSS